MFPVAHAVMTPMENPIRPIMHPSVHVRYSFQKILGFLSVIGCVESHDQVVLRLRLVKPSSGA